MTHTSPPSPVDAPVPVTADNFRRAECDLIMGNADKHVGVGKFNHFRDFYPVDAPIIRPNRDTLYSLSTFDLGAGPVTLTLPDAGDRFMSLQVIDEDQYTPQVHYGAGRFTFTREQIGTRYVTLGVRFLVDPGDPEDFKRVHALQDAILVEQPGGPGRFEAPNWDQASQTKVREALLVLGAMLPDTKRMFGARDQVDPVRHLIGTAMAYGGNPEKDALYLNVTPTWNDGKTIYRLTIDGSVPVDGFWSITVYNEKGYLEPNPDEAYSLNSITAKPDERGSIVIQFGDGKTPNCLPTTPGWNYMVRLYRPRAEVLDGRWQFPVAQPVG